MKIPKTNIELELKQGDIAAQNDINAVVNAANAQLTTGGGVAGAIHRAAGPELSEACQPMAPIRPGEAVISEAFNLPNDFVIHCLGPVYGQDKPEEQLLENCYKNALQLADQHNIKSIAFPAISSGAFGYPIDAAADVALKTIFDIAPELKSVKLIRMVLFSNRDLEIFNKKLKQLQ